MIKTKLLRKVMNLFGINTITVFVYAQDALHVLQETHALSIFFSFNKKFGYLQPCLSVLQVGNIPKLSFPTVVIAFPFIQTIWLTSNVFVTENVFQKNVGY